MALYITKLPKITGDSKEDIENSLRNAEKKLEELSEEKRKNNKYIAFFLEKDIEFLKRVLRDWDE